MYARHLGWLNATPEKSEKPRREMYQDGDPNKELVLLSEYEQSLVGHWMKLGTIEQTSAGLIALSWPAILSWANHFHKETFVEWLEHPRHSKRHKRQYTPILRERCSLVDWELETIRNMSQEYASEYSQASDPSRECPKPVFLDEVSEDVAIANANAMADAFRAMLGADTGPAVEAVRNS